jgi:hypothetical protein
MSALEVCVVAFAVAGVPGAGTSGIWLAVDAFRASGASGTASGVICVIGAVLWLCLLVLRTVIFSRVRRARVALVSPQLGDDYLTMAGEAGTFTLEDEDDFAEKTASPAPGPPRTAPQAPEVPEVPEGASGGGESSVVIAEEDSDMFSGGGGTKKSKKTKKHRKTTKSSKQPTQSTTPPPDQ